MASTSEYAIAAGWNVAIVSLTSVQAISAWMVNGRVRGPKSKPVNRYPIRTLAMSGKPYGDGLPRHEWAFGALSVAGITDIETTYLTAAAVIQAGALVTIQTRLHDRASWQRYNAYLSDFTWEDDGEYDSGLFLNVRLRFTGMVAI